eukprot:2353502-Ditylum_brightwellii.AAC.1
MPRRTQWKILRPRCKAQQDQVVLTLLLGETGSCDMALATVARWLANTRPAWAAYRALVAGRLIALDKCPGIRPVGISEILFRMIGKCVIAVCGDE